MVNMLSLNLDGILFEVFICEAKKFIGLQNYGIQYFKPSHTENHLTCERHKRHVASFIMSSRVMGLPFGHLQRVALDGRQTGTRNGFLRGTAANQNAALCCVCWSQIQNGGMETHKIRPGSQLIKILSSCTWRNETPKRPVICTLRLVRSGRICLLSHNR